MINPSSYSFLALTQLYIAPAKTIVAIATQLKNVIVFCHSVFAESEISEKHSGPSVMEGSAGSPSGPLRDHR